MNEGPAVAAGPSHQRPMSWPKTGLGESRAAWMNRRRVSPPTHPAPSLQRSSPRHAQRHHRPCPGKAAGDVGPCCAQATSPRCSPQLTVPPQQIPAGHGGKTASWLAADLLHLEMPACTPSSQRGGRRGSRRTGHWPRGQALERRWPGHTRTSPHGHPLTRGQHVVPALPGQHVLTYSMPKARERLLKAHAGAEKRAEQSRTFRCAKTQRPKPANLSEACAQLQEVCSNPTGPGVSSLPSQAFQGKTRRGQMAPRQKACCQHHDRHMHISSGDLSLKPCCLLPQVRTSRTPVVPAQSVACLSPHTEQFVLQLKKSLLRTEIFHFFLGV